MIAITLDRPVATDAVDVDGMTWVVIRFADGSRVTLHLADSANAAAIERAVMSDIQARRHCKMSMARVALEGGVA